MKMLSVVLLAGAVATVVVIAAKCNTNVIDTPREMTSTIALPKAKIKGQMSVEEALQRRRSRREFTDEALTLGQLGQLLWAAQGQTNERGFRTAPSAGGLYPMELYAVVGNVRGLEPGVYHYEVAEHGLKLVREGDVRASLQRACLNQAIIGRGPVCIVMGAVYARTASKYGPRSERYVHMEAGHIGQNIYLQAESLGLGSSVVGAFTDNKVKSLLGIGEAPVCVMPVGVPVEESD